MFKLLLCWRYLKSRYLALACIVSIMLGVATLIVVNSVMSGFSTKLKERLHGLLSDVLIDATTHDGFADYKHKMEVIRRSPIGDKIEAMCPTLESFALVQFRLANGEWVTKPVRLIGIDPESRSAIGGFKEYLLNPENQKAPSFKLTAEAQERYDRALKRFQREVEWERQQNQLDGQAPVAPPMATPESKPPMPPGIILGHALASYRKKGANADGSARDEYMLHPGDGLVVITYKGAGKLEPVRPQNYVVCDYFKSGMSEYDANLVFV